MYVQCALAVISDNTSDGSNGCDPVSSICWRHAIATFSIRTDAAGHVESLNLGVAISPDLEDSRLLAYFPHR